MSTQTSGRIVVAALLALGASAVLSGACGSDDNNPTPSTTQNNPIGGATSGSPSGTGGGASTMSGGGQGMGGMGQGGAGGSGAGPSGECVPFNTALPLLNSDGSLPPLP